MSGLSVMLISNPCRCSSPPSRLTSTLVAVMTFAQTPGRPRSWSWSVTSARGRAGGSSHTRLMPPRYDDRGAG